MQAAFGEGGRRRHAGRGLGEAADLDGGVYFDRIVEDVGQGFHDDAGRSVLDALGNALDCARGAGENRDVLADDQARFLAIDQEQPRRGVDTEFVVGLEGGYGQLDRSGGETEDVACTW